MDAFAARLVDVANDAGLALMISIGHRTRLFDVMAALEPSTSGQIAQAAGLDERYVREWLGAMTVGGVVEIDGEDGGSPTYRLPPEHAASLTRAARPNNVAVSMQWIAVLGAAESAVVECFRRGGGLEYGQYPRFHEVMAEESDQTVVAVIVDQVLPMVDGLTDWLHRGIDVLDVGCGSGRALITLASAFRRSRFVGRDASWEAVAAARERAEDLGLDNVRFEAADVAAMTDERAFDLVTAFDAIHDQARPDLVLRAIRKALRPGGTLLVQDIRGTSSHAGDIALPLAPLVYAISCMHCMSVSLASGGHGLGAAWGEATARQYFADAGFASVEKRQLPHDVLNDWYACT